MARPSKELLDSIYADRGHNGKYIWKKCKVCKTFQPMKRKQETCAKIINPQCRKTYASFKKAGNVTIKHIKKMVALSVAKRKAAAEARAEQCVDKLAAYRLGYLNGYCAARKAYERKMQNENSSTATAQPTGN